MKVTKKDFLGSLEGLNTEEKAFLEKNADIMASIVNKAIDGLVSSKDVEEKFKTLNDELQKSTTENASLVKKLNETEEIVKKLAESMEKAKKAGVGIDRIQKFDDAFDKMMNSGKMKALIDGTDKSTGFFGGFTVKDIATISSVEDNLDADIHLTRQSGMLANPFTGPKISIRDVIRTVQADPEHPNFSFLKVKSFDRNAQFETENGRLKQSNLEFEEVTVKPRRIGSYFDLSKDLLLARLQLRAWLVSMIPGIMTQAENAVVLFGDGKNNTLEGIATDSGVTSIEAQITASIVSGEAGSVKSVSAHKRGVFVEFNEPISKALDSMMITFEGAEVNTDLATAHPIVKLNDRQIYVLNAEYKGEEDEETLKAMTFKINHASYKKIEDPNSADVIASIFACLSFAQFAPNAIILNPITLFHISREKDALGRPLDLVQNIGGVDYIAGVPVIKMDAMPVGEYLAGDFQNGAFLFDYTKLEIAFAEDAETVLYNMVRLWFQEQLGLVVYMPWAFAQGNLEALREAIAADLDTDGLGIESDTTIRTV